MLRLLLTLRCFLCFIRFISSYNQNPLLDRLIGTTYISMQNVFASGSYLDTELPVTTDGKVHGGLHVVIRVLGLFRFCSLIHR